MFRLAFLMIIGFFPTVAYARGGTDVQITAFFYAALALGAVFVVMMTVFGGMIWYSKIIARIFCLPKHIEDSDWWPWVCFYGSAFLFLFISIASK